MILQHDLSYCITIYAEEAFACWVKVPYMV